LSQLEETFEESKMVPPRNPTWDSTPEEVEVGLEVVPYRVMPLEVGTLCVHLLIFC